VVGVCSAFANVLIATAEAASRNLFRLALTVIVLTFFQPSAAQAQEPKLEIFLVAVVSELRSELVSSTRVVDFGQVSSAYGGSFGVAIGFRPISKLGIEFDGFHLGKHSLDARERGGGFRKGLHRLQRIGKCCVPPVQVQCRRQ